MCGFSLTRKNKIQISKNSLPWGKSTQRLWTDQDLNVKFVFGLTIYYLLFGLNMLNH